MASPRAVSARVAFAALASSLVFASSASSWAIKSPSGNITCGEGDGAVVCLIHEQSFLEPRSCDGLWTMSASVRRRGRAKLNTGCFGGVPVDTTGARTLRYGETATRRGVRCKSSKRGMRCTNADGHGFSLSRRRGYRF